MFQSVPLLSSMPMHTTHWNPHLWTSMCCLALQSLVPNIKLSEEPHVIVGVGCVIKTSPLSKKKKATNNTYITHMLRNKISLISNTCIEFRTTVVLTFDRQLVITTPETQHTWGLDPYTGQPKEVLNHCCILLLFLSLSSLFILLN